MSIVPRRVLARPEPAGLVYSERGMLVLPQPNLARLRVVEVVKGDLKPRSCVDLNDISRLADGALASGHPLLLLRDRRWQSWVYIGSIGVEHADWLRELAEGKRATDMTTAEWEAQVATIAPHLQQPEPLVAEIAYGELANAPYAALRSLIRCSTRARSSHTHADEGAQGPRGIRRARVRRAGLLGRGVELLALLKTKLPNPAPPYAMLNYLSECPRADATNAATMLAAEQSY